MNKKEMINNVIDLYDEIEQQKKKMKHSQDIQRKKLITLLKALLAILII